MNERQRDMEGWQIVQREDRSHTLKAELELPLVVCLCGSTRFGDAFAAANKAETLAGRIVLSVGMLGHAEGLDMAGPVKAMLDCLHLRKIELADMVLILNVGGYIGDSTRRELAHARRLGKAIRFLEPHKES